MKAWWVGRSKDAPAAVQVREVGGRDVRGVRLERNVDVREIRMSKPRFRILPHP